MRLREILHVHIPTLGPKSTLRDAIDKMDVYQFPALVITNELKQVLAVITEGDVCRGIDRSGGLMKLAKEPALSFATQDPATASPDMEVSDALQLMLQSGITLLPIVEESRLYGIVLRVDLMQAMLLDLPTNGPNSS